MDWITRNGIEYCFDPGGQLVATLSPERGPKPVGVGENPNNGFRLRTYNMWGVMVGSCLYTGIGGAKGFVDAHRTQIWQQEIPWGK